MPSLYTGKQKLVDTGGRVDRFKSVSTWTNSELAKGGLRPPFVLLSELFGKRCARWKNTGPLRERPPRKSKRERSKFLSRISFADTEEKALAVLNEVRAQHRTANHNVYAYVLRDGMRTRYSMTVSPRKQADFPPWKPFVMRGWWTALW